MSKRVHDETVPESEAVDVKEESAKEEVKDGKTETPVDAKDDAEESSTKKQKVDETPGKPVRKRQFAKKKVALLFAYCGLDYQGLQINPNAKTVEGILIEALNKVNAIPDHHVSSLQKIQFMRACRTDKGVSALGNVISFKMQYNDAESLDTVRDRVNELLPPHVKLFHIYRTLGGFHCKNAVDYRVYEYICPTYAFVPIIAGSGAKFTTEMLEKVRQLFTVYEGTNNYHNFTTGKDAEDADANRYIKSITVSDPFVLDDIELVKIQLTGQSFVLNQIRKMIGLVIYAMRYTGSFKTIVYVLKETRYVHFVMAPGEFLYLERAAYNGYNRKLDNVKSDLPRIDFRQFQDERDAFKTLYVYAPVLAKEKSEKIMRTYLSTVDRGHIGIDKENVDIINWIKDLESKEIEWVKQAKKNETNPDWQ